MGDQLRVGVLGAGGRMGREACRTVAAASDLQLVTAVDPGCSGQGLRSLVGDAVPNVEVQADLDAVSEVEAEVVVDFTVAEAARANLRWCSEHGVHIVVGTSGLAESELPELAKRFESSGANALIVPNFAIGAVLLMRMCEMAAPLMDGVEIIELHHDGKRDAPSGTAVRTAERIQSARAASGAPSWPDDPTDRLSLEGARGGVGAGGVRVHSIRLPGLVAHQEVIFGAPGETLTIRHDTLERSSFMPGVLLAIRGVRDLPGLTVGLEPLMGL